MTLRQRLCKYLCTQEEPEHPFTTLRHRSGQHIRQKLQIQFPNAHIRIADSDYSTPTRAEFEVWLKKDAGDLRKYHAEWYDCDDFARAMRCELFKIGQQYETMLSVAYCEGHTKGGYHAFNLLIDNTDAIHIIEPQTDLITPANESNYIPDFIQL